MRRARRRHIRAVRQARRMLLLAAGQPGVQLHQRLRQVALRARRLMHP